MKANLTKFSVHANVISVSSQHSPENPGQLKLRGKSDKKLTEEVCKQVKKCADCLSQSPSACKCMHSIVHIGAQEPVLHRRRMQQSKCMLKYARSLAQRSTKCKQHRHIEHEWQAPLLLQLYPSRLTETCSTFQCLCYCVCTPLVFFVCSL